MKLGISSYTYTWAVGVPGHPPPRPMSAGALLARAAELGVGVVQIADNLPLHRLPEAELAALVEQSQALGIEIEVGTRGIASAHLRAYLDLAIRFRSPLLRVVIDTADHHPSLPETVELIGQSLPAFESAGVVLAIENHDRFSVAEFVHILEALDSPHAGICLDTVNSFGALEGPGVVVQALGPRTVNLHIKDFSVRRADHMMGFSIEGTPAGQGRLDVPALLAELDEYGREFNAILKLWTPPEANMDATLHKEDTWARASIPYLRRYIPD